MVGRDINITVYTCPRPHLHVDHLRGLRADGPDHLVAGLVSLDADPVPGGLRLAALGSVYLETVPATDQLPATHRGECLGAELRHVLEAVHRTLGLGGEAGAGQGEAEQGHQLHGGGWRVEGELSGSAESQISTTTTSTATAPPPQWRQVTLRPVVVWAGAGCSTVQCGDCRERLGQHWNLMHHFIRSGS